MLFFSQNPELQDALLSAADTEQRANESLDLSDAKRRTVFQQVVDFVVAGSVSDDRPSGRTPLPRAAKASAADKISTKSTVQQRLIYPRLCLRLQVQSRQRLRHQVQNQAKEAETGARK